MKQTAVEWLIEQIYGDHTEQWQKEIEQAKEMEKEQLTKSYIKGSSDAVDDLWKFMNPND